MGPRRTTMKITDTPLNPDMARAYRDGLKSETRRVIGHRILDRWTGLDHHRADLLTMCPYGKGGFDGLRFLTTWAVPPQ